MSLTGLGEVADLAKDILDRFKPDATQAEKDALAAQLAQLQAASAQDAAQSAVNQVEAQSPNMFIAGGRPFVIWVCGIGLAISFLGPLISYFAGLAGHTLVFPQLDTTSMNTDLLALLGLGGMRTYEKLKGVNNLHG